MWEWVDLINPLDVNLNKNDLLFALNFALDT